MKASKRITIRVSESLVRRLKKHASIKRRSESALVREALESYLENAPPPSSAYEAAKATGLIGCVSRAPSDLSTNRKYFERLGESR